MPESSKTFINGPINVVRLEGEVNRIKKVIYLFMDIHQPTGTETECDDVLSKDVKDFLVDQFRKIKDDKMIDFFLETMPSLIPMRRFNEYKENYIHNVIKMFSKAFQKKDKDAVVINELFPTIRFHHMDPRDYFEANSYTTFNNLLDSVDSMWKSKYIVPSDFDYMSNYIQLVNNDINFMYTYFFKESLDKIKDVIAKKKPIVPASMEEHKMMTQQDFDIQSLSLIKKIKSRYNHKDVMNNVTKILNTYVKTQFDDYFKLDKERIKMFDDMKKKIVAPRVLNNNKEKPNWGTPYETKLTSLAELDIHLSNMFDAYLHAFVGLMDVYFLRRFLDKDYITNVVAYTGAMHSLNYIYYLVKYFGFKVTHYDYANPKISDYNKEIKKSKSPRDLGFIFYPPILKQCTNLSNFPKNFD